jgi:hypothetical protein
MTFVIPAERLRYKKTTDVCMRDDPAVLHQSPACAAASSAFLLLLRA